MNSASKILFVAAVITALLPVNIAMAYTAGTQTSNITPSTISSGTCPTQSFLTGPTVKSKLLILSISWIAKNDEDSGIFGYWAMDHFKETLKVWALPDGSFYVLKKYSGVFQAPQGGISPGTGGTQNESVSGTILGGYVANFTGQFTPGSNPTTGKIGTFDYGGTLTDILKGTYGNGQTGDSHPFDFTSLYFTNVQNFNINHWGWAYELNPIYISGVSTNQWCNYNAIDGGNSGDILVPSS